MFFSVPGRGSGHLRKGRDTGGGPHNVDNCGGGMDLGQVGQMRRGVERRGGGRNQVRSAAEAHGLLLHSLG